MLTERFHFYWWSVMSRTVTKPLTSLNSVSKDTAQLLFKPEALRNLLHDRKTDSSLHCTFTTATNSVSQTRSAALTPSLALPHTTQTLTHYSIPDRRYTTHITLAQWPRKLTDDCRLNHLTCCQTDKRVEARNVSQVAFRAFNQELTDSYMLKTFMSDMFRDCGDVKPHYETKHKSFEQSYPLKTELRAQKISNLRHICFSCCKVCLIFVSVTVLRVPILYFQMLTSHWSSPAG